MLDNGSLRNCCEAGGRGALGAAGRAAAPRPAWVVAALSGVLIFTTVVDIVGSLLVVVSVFKNRKLRNSGRGGLAGWERGGSHGAEKGSGGWGRWWEEGCSLQG